MSPASDSRSIHSLLLVVVFQLGIFVLVVGDVASAVRGYGTVISNVAQISGAVTAIGALLALLVESLSVD